MISLGRTPDPASGCTLRERHPCGKGAASCAPASGALPARRPRGGIGGFEAVLRPSANPLNLKRILDRRRLAQSLKETPRTRFFTAPGEGDYVIRASASRGEGHLLGGGEVHLHVGPSQGEYFDAGLRRGSLQRLAEETGGVYYEPETVASLPEDIRYTGGGVTLTEEKDLWDMPALFLLLVALVGAEWLLRRRRGLV